MGNLYGFVGPVGNIEVALVQLDAALQHSLGEFFRIYEDQFREGIDEVIGFDGGYRVDDHQVFQLPLTQEMIELSAQIERGAAGREIYDPRVRPPEDLRALAWVEQNNGTDRILVQNFTRAQALSTKTTLWFSGDTFTKLDQPALVVGNKIDAVIDHGVIQFKSFNVAKQIFDLFAIYREATNADIRTFSNLANVLIDDVDDFCEKIRSTDRKLLFSVSQSGILAQKSADEIQTLARAVDIDIPIDNNRIVLQPGRDLYKYLKFLDNSIYRSPVTNERWMANSRRRM